MVTKVRKWGNSLGLRLPSTIAKEAGIEDGSAVDISVVDDRIVIHLSRPTRYRFSDLVSLIREDNIHDEFETGDAMGREVW